MATSAVAPYFGDVHPIVIDKLPPHAEVLTVGRLNLGIVVGFFEFDGWRDFDSESRST